MQKTDVEKALDDAAIKKLHAAKPIRRVTFEYLATVDKERGAMAKRMARAAVKTDTDRVAVGAMKTKVKARLIIFNLVKAGISSVSKIQEAANINLSAVNSMLAAMEQNGSIKCDRTNKKKEGNRYFL
jgi:predicted transcriptional regulator